MGFLEIFFFILIINCLLNSLKVWNYMSGYVFIPKDVFLCENFCDILNIFFHKGGQTEVVCIT